MLSFSQYAFLIENRIQWLKDNVKKIDTEHDHGFPANQFTGENAEEEKAHSIINHMAAHDPTHVTPQGKPGKHIYTQWMVNQYQKKHVHLEDASQMGQDLAYFHQHKATFEKKDINQYGHVGDLSTAVSTHQNGGVRKGAFSHPGATEVHNKDGLTVHRLDTKEASQHTRKCFDNSWCTSRPEEEHNYFDSYSARGPLYVVHTKDGSHYQFHFGQRGASEIKDAANRDPNIHTLVAKHPELKTVEAFQDKHIAFASNSTLNKMVKDVNLTSRHSVYQAETIVNSDREAKVLHPDVVRGLYNRIKAEQANPENDDHDYEVRNLTYNLLYHHHADENMIRTAYKASPEARFYDHPKAPEDIKMELAKSGAVDDRIVSRQNSSPELLRMAHEHHLERKRNPKTSLKTPSETLTVSKFLAHPNLPQDIHDHYLNKGIASIKHDAIRSPRTPASYLDSIKDQPMYHGSILMNPNTTVETLRHIRKHHDDAGTYVRHGDFIHKAIAKHPNADEALKVNPGAKVKVKKTRAKKAEAP